MSYFKITGVQLERYKSVKRNTKSLNLGLTEKIHIRTLEKKNMNITTFLFLDKGNMKYVVKRPLFNTQLFLYAVSYDL